MENQFLTCLSFFSDFDLKGESMIPWHMQEISEDVSSIFLSSPILVDLFWSIKAWNTNTAARASQAA